MSIEKISINNSHLILHREVNQSRYRSAKVRVLLLQESVYKLHKVVQVLKITEIVEDYGTLKSDISEAGVTKNSSKNHHTKVDRDFEVNIVTAESASNLSSIIVSYKIPLTLSNSKFHCRRSAYHSRYEGSAL